ncbi:hypothetical protein NC651_011223 [Populus alba x Populus x berolinensis]|nr:hypothetical protein NC651_011223 [Populus alba x Populus x berolinensis]
MHFCFFIPLDYLFYFLFLLSQDPVSFVVLLYILSRFCCCLCRPLSRLSSRGMGATKKKKEHHPTFISSS